MPRRLAVIAAVVILLGTSPSVGLAAPPQFTPGAPGIGDPYYPLDGNGGYDISHYDLALGYDPATDQLNGIATITATATQNLSSFNLDFVGLRLRSLTVDGSNAPTSRDAHELTVRLPRGIRTGSTFTVVATYDGVPQTLEDFGVSGFIHTDDGAIVMGEPHGAATWFPANDHPRDKASFTFHISAPQALKVIANGVLTGQATAGGRTTWTWDAPEPMNTYLAFMAIGNFNVHAYEANGLKFWDAVDPKLIVASPAITPIAGTRFLWSQMADGSYKRLTHLIDVPPGGGQLTFRVNRDTEQGWDFLFVESRTAGAEDWTTLPDANGHTTQDVGACPYNYDGQNPFLAHYLTPVLVDPGDPSTPDDDFYSCDPVGSSGAWNAANGTGDGWENWRIVLANPTASAIHREISIAYASDGFVQWNGVALDDVVVSTGQGTTSFEPDGDPLDGWVIQPDPPAGTPPNANTWTFADFVPERLGRGVAAQKSLDLEPDILQYESTKFGPYPFTGVGGVVDNVGVFFALENQTRPTYSPFFFDGDQPTPWVIVHENAHQWFGDSLSVDTWKDIWLNEGFATYAEWLWGEDHGFDSTEANYEGWAQNVPPDDPFWDLAIGDPSPDHQFDFEIYARGALTLHALRRDVGDKKFFEILKTWAGTHAGGNVTTEQFVALASQVAKKDLHPLFAMWLGSGYPDFGLPPGQSKPPSAKNLPAASRDLVRRMHDRQGQPFRDAGLVKAR
jgi:hypothetical protein